MAKRGADLSDFQKGQIYALKFHANFSRPRISNCLEISENTIKKYLQRLSSGDDAEGTNRYLSGRKKITTDEDDENIVRKSSQDPFMPAKEIQQDLRLTCSRRTLLLRIARYNLI